jgi:predicted ferric reductase
MTAAARADLERWESDGGPAGAPASLPSSRMRRVRHFFSTKRSGQMLMTIAVVLLVLWALGLVTAYTMGGFIHVLLVVAIIVVLVKVIQGRRL